MKLPRLIALTPGDVQDADAPRLTRAIQSALGAGLCGVLLREERLSDRIWLDVARSIRAAIDDAPAPAWFGVHDRVHLAQSVGADGIHLGFRSLRASVVRRRFVNQHLPSSPGSPAWIGVSTHAESPSEAGDADYAFFGPVLETPSKPPGSLGWREPVGFDGLRERCEAMGAGIPILALGGMQPEHFSPALGAGAHGLAVLGGILPQADPARCTRAYLRALRNEPAHAG